MTKSALVIGGGIAGIQASLDLADRGVHVYLVEKEATIGGAMSRLDKTFPTNDCSACILSPKMADCAGHPNISLLTYHEVMKVDGDAGDFKVTVKKKARYVIAEECTGCEDCVAKCPVRNIPDDYEYGLSTRRAIYIPHAQAVPRVALIDPDNCRMIQSEKCGVCAKVCQKGAINYDDKDEEIVINVGSVIAATGFAVWDANIAAEYGYGRYDNVITSMEFERYMCASGCTSGMITKPSSGEKPARIAFVQCCGSRSQKEGWKKYCSSICCMSATKEAMLTKESMPEVEQDIYFMDIRSYGKEFEDYIHRAEDQYGIGMHRGARVSHLEEDPETKQIILNYTDDENNGMSEVYDLVVLSVALAPPKEAQEFADILGVELNDHGFCKTTVYEPLETTREGVFATGAFAAPKDIPTSVAEASGASAKAAKYIVGEGFVPAAPKEYPAEKDVSGQEPRVGVWVCHCGTNIAGVVDVKEVTEYASKLPGVAYATDVVYACAQDTLIEISESIKEHDLNRVVVASCTPRTHEPLFKESARDGGLNPYLVNMANIRDQCSWIHMQASDAATEKSKDLVRMAVAKAELLEPLKGAVAPVIQTAAVVGGGITGMTAALDLAAQGFTTYLVEKENELGGFARKFRHKEDGISVSDFLQKTIDAVNSNDLIEVHTGASVVDIPGYVGNFTLKLSNGTEIETGAVLLAIGAEQYQPTEFNYGSDPKVMTMLEVEQKVDAGEFNGQNVAFISCVGSRNDDVAYCSRVCCSGSLRNAIQIKMNNPMANVTYFHKDVRTYGFREDIYFLASQLGINFVRYPVDDDLPAYDGKVVKAFDSTLGEDIEVPVDAVVLAAGIAPNTESLNIAQMVKVPISKDGFFFEAHQKLRPVDFATEGVYVAGSAHWPKFMDECMAQASGAASRMITIISRPNRISEGTVASVNAHRCDGCGVCEGCCDYNAIEIIDCGNGKLKAEVNPALCKSCGSCVAACPSGAMEQAGFKTSQIVAEIDAYLDYAGGE